jgi:hypothetical protein
MFMQTEIKKIEKKIRVGKYDLMRFQVYTEYLFFKKEHLIPLDLDIIILLGLNGVCELSKFCAYAARTLFPDTNPEDYAIKAQNIRNRIVKLEKRGLIQKSKSGFKKIRLTDESLFVKDSNVLLSYNILNIETIK